jgi:hypothetical protein
MRFSALLLSMAAFSQTPPPLDSRNTDIPHTDTHFSPKAFWRHAIGTAVCARLLAIRLKIDPEAALAGANLKFTNHWIGIYDPRGRKLIPTNPTDPGPARAEPEHSITSSTVPRRGFR